MTRSAIALLVALAFPAMANATDFDRGRREHHRDRRALHDDMRDARMVEQLLQDYERTWATLDRPGLHGVELRVQAALDDEAREAAYETDEAKRELHRDRWRAREDRWREREAGWRDPRGAERNRREAADDRQDLMRAADYRAKIEALRAEWANLREQRVYPAMIRKHAVLEELVRLSHMEIHGDVQELREDDRGR